jgi:hypothetical protein
MYTFSQIFLSLMIIFNAKKYITFIYAAYDLLNIKLRIMHLGLLVIFHIFKRFLIGHLSNFPLML